MSKHNAVIVTWIDSSAFRGWQSMDAGHEASTITSIGWVLSKTKDLVVISSCISDTGNVRDALAIPMCSVISMKKLKFYVEGQ